MTTAPTAAQPCDRCGQHVLTDVSDGATSRTWLYAQASPPGLTRTSVDRPVLRNLTQHEPHGCQVTPTCLARLASALCAHLFSLRRQVATHPVPRCSHRRGYASARKARSRQRPRRAAHLLDKAARLQIAERWPVRSSPGLLARAPDDFRDGAAVGFFVMATRAHYLLNVQGVGAAHVQQVTRELGFNDLVLIAP